MDKTESPENDIQKDPRQLNFFREEINSRIGPQRVRILSLPPNHTYPALQSSESHSEYSFLESGKYFCITLRLPWGVLIVNHQNYKERVEAIPVRWRPKQMPLKNLFIRNALSYNKDDIERCKRLGINNYYELAGYALGVVDVDKYVPEPDYFGIISPPEINPRGSFLKGNTKPNYLCFFCRPRVFERPLKVNEGNGIYRVEITERIRLRKY